MFISWMLITLSFKKSLIVEEFQGNYLQVTNENASFWLLLVFLLYVHHKMNDNFPTHRFFFWLTDWLNKLIRNERNKYYKIHLF